MNNLPAIIARDEWQERELHCKRFGHSLTHVLRREPIYRDVSPEIGEPDDKTQDIPYVEIRLCACCKLEFRTAK